MKSSIKALITSLALVAVLGLPALASADTIYHVDAPTLHNPDSVLTVSSDLWFAQKFTLDEAAALESISVFFTAVEPGSDFYFNLYSGDRVYSTDVHGYLLEGLFATIDFNFGSGGWYGANNLGQTLAAGSYWLEVAARSGGGSIAQGYVGSEGSSATWDMYDYVWDPASGEYVMVKIADIGERYVNYDGEQSIGLDIQGPSGSAETPEPSTLALAALGAAGVFCLQRRFRK